MIRLRPFAELGRHSSDWLEARYHFSFADYVDPEHMGFGLLRVWNDDTIRPGTGFPPHGHRDMEIVTYVRQGAITHEDHLGNVGRTQAGDVQVMSAGSGIRHAEYNREAEDALIFQIWIHTARPGAPPRWGNRRFPGQERHGRLVPLALGREGHDEALPIYQDAAVLGATLPKGQGLRHPLAGRRAYLVPARGAVAIDGVRVDARCGAAVEGVEDLVIEALEDAEIVVADLPG